MKRTSRWCSTLVPFRLIHMNSAIIFRVSRLDSLLMTRPSKVMRRHYQFNFNLSLPIRPGGETEKVQRAGEKAEKEGKRQSRQCVWSSRGSIRLVFLFSGRSSFFFASRSPLSEWLFLVLFLLSSSSSQCQK